MKLTLLKLLCIAWLLIITPLFGVFPLLLILHIPMPRYFFFLTLAVLTDIVSLFIQTGNGSDEGPPLTKLGTITMIVIVFGIATLAVNFLWKSRRQKTVYISAVQKPT